MSQYISDATKKRWAEQMQSDYPNLPGDMIMTVLDLYQSDKDYVEKMVKDLKKGHKGPVTVRNKLTLEEMQRLHELGTKKQEEIEKNFEAGLIPATDDNEAIKETCIIQEENISTV